MKVADLTAVGSSSVFGRASRVVTSTSAGMRVDHIDADGNAWLRIHLWRDPETGCEYVQPGYAESWLQRMGRDGKQVCR